MYTIDMLAREDILVHCAVDMGGVGVGGMSDIVDFAAQCPQHQATVVHTWHSRSSAAEFAHRLVLDHPWLFLKHGTDDFGVGIGGPVICRIRGLYENEIPEGFPPREQTIYDLVKKTKEIVCVDQTVGVDS
jgi:hypothetical protein